MMKAMTIAAAMMVAFFSSGCAQMGWGGSSDTGATGGTGASAASGEVVMLADPAGTASAGTGSVMSGTLGYRETTSAGQGLDD